MAVRHIASHHICAAGRWANTIKGVIFDMDGTLITKMIDFQRIRKVLDVPANQDILAAIEAAPTEAQDAMERAVRNIEMEAWTSTKIMPGVVKACKFLDDMNIPRGLVTRNNSEGVKYFHSEIFPLSEFSPALSREFRPYKPDPAAIFHCCKTWNISPLECIMIGDCPEDDIVCGNRAGCATILLDDSNQYSQMDLMGDLSPTFKIKSMEEAVPILELLLGDEDLTRLA